MKKLKGRLIAFLWQVLRVEDELTILRAENVHLSSKVSTLQNEGYRMIMETEERAKRDMQEMEFQFHRQLNDMEAVVKMQRAVVQDLTIKLIKIVERK